MRAVSVRRVPPRCSITSTNCGLCGTLVGRNVRNAPRIATIYPIRPYCAVVRVPLTVRHLERLADPSTISPLLVGKICPSFRECHKAVGVCGVTNDEDM